MAATKRGVRDYTFWINGKLYDEIESLVEADVELNSIQFKSAISYRSIC